MSIGTVMFRSIFIFILLIACAYGAPHATPEPQGSYFPIGDYDHAGVGGSVAGGVSAAHAASVGGPSSSHANVSAASGGLGDGLEADYGDGMYVPAGGHGQATSSGSAGASAESPFGGTSDTIAGTNVGSVGIGGTTGEGLNGSPRKVFT